MHGGHRPGRGRRAATRVGLALLLVGATLGQTAPAKAFTVATGCADVLFLGARGSGQSQAGVTDITSGRYDAGTGFGPQVYGAWTAFRSKAVPRSVASGAVEFPAADVGLIATNPAAYFAGLENGVSWTLDQLRARASSCPRERVVLSGYSQGAMVMHRVLRLLAASALGPRVLPRLDAAILIADGDAVPQDTVTRFGTAPATATGIGLVDTAVSASGTSRLPAGVGSRVQHVCMANDPVCDFNGSIDIRIHLRYKGTPEVVDAAAAAAARVKQRTATEWDFVSAGDGHTCGIRADRSLWCWGYNASGAVGTGPVSDTPSSTPVRVGTGTDWTQVSAGDGHTCGLRRPGSLWCWGTANWTPTATSPVTPRRIGTATDWLTVSAGNQQTCGIRSDRSLWCFVVDQSTGRTPVRVGAGTSWRSVSVGGTSSCAISTASRLFCWGFGFEGQLGLGPAVSSAELPTQVGTASTWSAVSAGDVHVCATRTDHTLLCWGMNGFGELGDGTLVNRFVPTRIGTAADWSAVTPGGFFHTCGTKTSGQLWCWGDNRYGALGTGGTVNSLRPVRVGALADWAVGDAGGAHSCYVRQVGSLWCWGEGSLGQLGLGPTGPVTSPTQVTG